MVNITNFSIAGQQVPPLLGKPLVCDLNVLCKGFVGGNLSDQAVIALVLAVMVFFMINLRVIDLWSSEGGLLSNKEKIYYVIQGLLSALLVLLTFIVAVKLWVAG